LLLGLLELKLPVGRTLRKERVVSSLLRRLRIRLSLRVAARERLSGSDLVSHGLLILLDCFEKVNEIGRRALGLLSTWS
jgi:hypothetical protein